MQTRLSQLLRLHSLDVRVVAPVPWFPFDLPAFGTYAKFAATPRRATLGNGLRVSYPRYLMLPRLGVARQPDNMARAAWADVRALAESGWKPDLIDAHYLYPDGVAAALLADRIGVPFVMTARGTDVNVLAKLPGPGQRIRWAAERAAAVITVSTRLKGSLVELGIDAERVVVLRNGVDTELFFPEDADSARAQLNLPEGRLAACVGNLVAEKGFDLAIETLPHLPDWHLVLVGDGPMRGTLLALGRRLGVAERIHILPTMRQRQLRGLYSAAEVLLLTSTREGWPNVVLEALACGTPVVTVDVGAVDEMLTDAVAGCIVAGREPARLAQAVQAVTAAQATPESIRSHAMQFDWATISKGQMEVFSRALRAPLAAAWSMSNDSLTPKTR